MRREGPENVVTAGEIEGVRIPRSTVGENARSDKVAGSNVPTNIWLEKRVAQKKKKFAHMSPFRGNIGRKTISGGKVSPTQRADCCGGT